MHFEVNIKGIAQSHADTHSHVDLPTTLVIQAPLTIKNLLPRDMEFRFQPTYRFNLTFSTTLKFYFSLFLSRIQQQSNQSGKLRCGLVKKGDQQRYAPPPPLFFFVVLTKNIICWFILFWIDSNRARCPVYLR